MTPRFRFASLLAAAALVALVLSRPVAAHEGEEHADEVEPAPPTSVMIAGGPYAAHSEAHELLVRTGVLEPGHAHPIRLLLADYATNAPIEGATLEVADAARDTAWTARAEAPGVYTADVSFPEVGYARLEVVVRRGDDIDLLSLDSVRIGPPELEAAAASGRGGGLPPWVFALFAGLGLAAIVALVLVGRARGPGRRSPRALGLVVALSLAGLVSGTAGGHEGELHGDEEEAPAAAGAAGTGIGPAGGGGGAAPAGSRYMAKESQFQLGLLTAVARLDTLAETRRVFGTVVADPSAAADVVAPQAGKFVGRRNWRIGDRVSRGQALGGLLVIDELPVRAPIGGTIAEISAVPGQTVTAGQVIARVVNLDRVRVEVAVYGEALSAATRAIDASVRLPSVPGRSFAARIEGLAPAATGGPSVPLVISVANAGELLRPGMVVEVELRLPGAAPAIVVPVAAVVTTERGPSVFVKVAPEAFVLRPVTLGPSAGQRIAVRSGVVPGERVVVSAAAPLLSSAETPR